MRKKGIAALAAALALAVSVSGCGSSAAFDGNETVATLDETTNVPVGEVSLLLRYQQAQMESSYGSLFGSNIYAQDLTSSGTAYGETAKTELMEQFELMYVLEAEAANYGAELTDEEKTEISEAAAEFISANSDKTKEALGVDQAITEHLLSLLKLQNKMYYALTEDVDTEVSDEEALQKRISYVFVSTAGTETDDDGNTIDLTDEQKAEKKALLQSVLDAAAESGDLSAAVDEINETLDEDSQLVANSVSFGADSTSPAEEVRAEADTLEEGELGEIVETDTGYYAIQLTSAFDEEATDLEKQSIVQSRRDELYQERYAELQENHVFAIDEDVLAKLTFDRVYSIDTTGTEE